MDTRAAASRKGLHDDITLTSGHEEQYTPIKSAAPGATTPTTKESTPYANLKMLSSLASPQLKAFEEEQQKKKSVAKRKRQILADEDSEEYDDDDDDLDRKGGIAGGEAGSAEAKGSRKDKSLGVLSDNFLKQYRDGGEKEICLDDAAVNLKVERRRIYDIVNVLEGVGVVERKAKNKYTWYGLSRLPKTLASLKVSSAPARSVDELRPRHTNSSRASLGSGSSAKGGAAASADSDSLSMRKERSLGILAQRFLLMFLECETDTVLLDDAAQRLVLNEALDEKKQKTKVRRLYDIANIFCSLNLIEKVSVFEPKGRKSGFRWIGMDLSEYLSATPKGSEGRFVSTHGVQVSVSVSATSTLFPPHLPPTPTLPSAVSSAAATPAATITTTGIGVLGAGAFSSHLTRSAPPSLGARYSSSSALQGVSTPSAAAATAHATRTLASASSSSPTTSALSALAAVVALPSSALFVPLSHPGPAAAASRGEVAASDEPADPARPGSTTPLTTTTTTTCGASLSTSGTLMAAAHATASAAATVAAAAVLVAASTGPSPHHVPAPSHTPSPSLPGAVSGAGGSGGVQRTLPFHFEECWESREKSVSSPLPPPPAPRLA